MGERVGATRRGLLRAAAGSGMVAAGAALAPPRGRAAADGAAPVLRLGILQFGTLQWLAATIHAHGLDTVHGFDLQTVTLASNDASRVALMAGAADVVVTDWLFVARQRSRGTALSFAPFSAAAGGVMVPQASRVAELADLRGLRLGVAGGSGDRSWLLVQAAGRRAGIDLAREAHVNYGAPPLLGAKLQQGELDALLTFWTFASRLEAEGFREAVSVAGCGQALGLPADLDLLGYVFHEEWGKAHRTAIDGFLAAAGAAQALLARDDAAWAALRPMMQLPDGAAGEAVMANLRRRFAAGIVRPGVAEQEHAAAQVLAILGPDAGAAEGPAVAGTDDGKADGTVLASLPSGVFWPLAN